MEGVMGPLADSVDEAYDNRAVTGGRGPRGGASLVGDFISGDVGSMFIPAAFFGVGAEGRAGGEDATSSCIIPFSRSGITRYLGDLGEVG